MQQERKDPQGLARRIVRLVDELGRTVRRVLQLREFEPTKELGARLGSHIGKHLAGRSRMPSDSVQTVLADLDASRPELDQPLEESSTG